jgi:hypothetical protein
VGLYRVSKSLLKMAFEQRPPFSCGAYFIGKIYQEKYNWRFRCRTADMARSNKCPACFAVFRAWFTEFSFAEFPKHFVEHRDGEGASPVPFEAIERTDTSGISGGAPTFSAVDNMLPAAISTSAKYGVSVARFLVNRVWAYRFFVRFYELLFQFDALFFGRLKFFKRFAVFIRCCAQLVFQERDVSFLNVGRARARNYFESGTDHCKD